MSNTSTFWKRVGSAFRLGNDGNLSSTATPTVLELRPLRGASMDSDQSSAGLFGWQSKRKREAAELRERQSRFMELLAAMRTHFEAQDRRSEKLESAIQSVAGTLDEISQSQKEQSQSLAVIAQHTDAAAKNAAAMLATTIELPASLQAQAEAVRTVAKRMESAQETDAELVGSLQNLGRALDELHRAGALQVETLQRLNMSDARNQDQFRALLKAQNRRIYWVCGVIVAAFALSTAGLIAALAQGWIRLP